MFWLQPLEQRAPQICARFAGRALAAVGAPDFMQQIMHAVDECLVPVDYVSMFQFASDLRPVFLGTDTQVNMSRARVAARNYIAGCFNEDPNLGVLRAERRREEYVSYQTRESVGSISYRLNCYERPGLLDRFSVISRTPDQVSLTLSFYRGVDSRSLAESERFQLADHSPLILAAVRRHLELTSPAAQGFTGLLAQVQERFSALSRREAEVCAGILAGWTQAEIGEHLGIKLTSVITHRKRAYQRLGVADQRGLFRHWMSFT